MVIIIIYEAETLSTLTQAKFLHNRVTTSFQSMVHGWLVGSPLASGVCVSDGGREWTRRRKRRRTVVLKKKTRKSTSSSFLPSPFLISKVWNIFERKKHPPTGLQLVFFFKFLTFSGDLFSN
jgi:hypothetical protein